tara:strand:+ start:75340 stop:76053 length:714 start_codon:yes stop_codon:yes gene_type:complete
MGSRESLGTILTISGLSIASMTALYALFEAPSVSGGWEAPEAYRILYFHAPFAWLSFISFTLLFIGSIMWYTKRSEKGWIWFQTASDLGLIFGLGVITSGPIWGSVEWGTPWDWGDLRLNTFGLLTAVAMFLVLSRRSQPDTSATRDTLSSVGLFGFALVPISALATTWYQKRHPEVLITGSEDGSAGMDDEIRIVLILSFLILNILFAGFVILSNHRYLLASKLEILKSELDEGLI